MIIRTATPDDALPMSGVLLDIIALTGRTRPHDPAFTLSHYIAAPDGIRCSVAVDEDGAVLGFQSLKRAVAGNRYDVPEGWGIIGTHIGPRAHRRGVGRALFAVSRQAAIDAGLSRIDASIGADNPMGLRYYEAMGFRTWREGGAIVQKMLVLDPAP
ncbi:GNAT family N-acetyltransferase [uncultured Sphingomonas sp.]|uniref:GNAT family N-acetyltransferase n=1 Tax=uncultured Sphingomonas sp. TaxID=158754 RepID=UPI0025DC43EA|nr:GNAT family N-acetyltransferase [uncultured Sphingomonas sp.]